MADILIQTIGFLGVIAFIVSYQLKSNRSLYLFQLLGSLLFCVQFFLLEAYSGCLSMVLNILRYALLTKYNQWEWVRRKELAYIFCAAFAIVLIFTWAGPVTILAFAASSVSTVFYWTNNAKLIRAANLFCASPCWLVYDIFAGSWGGVLNEAITLTSIIVSVYRFGWKALGDPDSEFQK